MRATIPTNDPSLFFLPLLLPPFFSPPFRGGKGEGRVVGFSLEISLPTIHRASIILPSNLLNIPDESVIKNRMKYILAIPRRRISVDGSVDFL